MDSSKDTTKIELQALKDQVSKMRTDYDALSQEFYKNNFTSHQDFNKSCTFSSTLKVPVYSTLPTCTVGDIAAVGGKLYICSATDTWTIVGTQS